MVKMRPSTEGAPPITCLNALPLLLINLLTGRRKRKATEERKEAD
ncbi:hypothetical protein E2C01_014110 [Portunus trituberculatus]|uniref:Uncharacterized protein n=1 Tax=Portunus trituberculatus TaxID=210409 RepID=A0A5B7DJ08_PORTR|nr:hypothetical protein [Portunus trituberculatus]